MPANPNPRASLVPSQRSSRDGHFRPTPSPPPQDFQNPRATAAQRREATEQRGISAESPILHSIRSPKPTPLVAADGGAHHAARRCRRRRVPRAVRLRAPLHLLPRGRRCRRRALPLSLLLVCRGGRCWGTQGADQQPPPQVARDGVARHGGQGPLAHAPPPAATVAVAAPARGRGLGLRRMWQGRGRRKRRRRGEPADPVAEGRPHREWRVRAGVPRHGPRLRRAPRCQAGR